MKDYLSLVKFSHTIFALPFAFIGFSLGIKLSSAGFSWQTFALMLVCMVTARNAAMAFNRWVDRDIDRENPRTAVREIPSGKIPHDKALWFVLINVIVFISACYFINSLCFYLSPVALGVVLGYSLTKRFTFLCHLILGLGLSLAPVGAFFTIQPAYHIVPILYGLSVLFWVAGFDIIYALQDDEFDKANLLFSIPSYFGRPNALIISTCFHILTTVFLILAAIKLNELVGIGYPHIAAILGFVFLLVYQHVIVKVNDLSRVNLAFFTTNGVASLIFGILVCLDLFL